MRLWVAKIVVCISNQWMKFHVGPCSFFSECSKTGSMWSWDQVISHHECSRINITYWEVTTLFDLWSLLGYFKCVLSFSIYYNWLRDSWNYVVRNFCLNHYSMYFWTAWSFVIDLTLIIRTEFGNYELLGFSAALSKARLECNFARLELWTFLRHPFLGVPWFINRNNVIQKLEFILLKAIFDLC